MEEKKLTDEKSMFNYIANDVLGQVKPLYLRKRIVREIFDLIRRLQDENERLMERVFDCTAVIEYNEKFSKEIQSATILLEQRNKEIAEQKTEIERLTEERDVYLDDCSAVRHKIRQEIEEKFELQKQVDELKKENNDLLHERQMAFMDGHQQAVKDTAKEIITMIDGTCASMKTYLCSIIAKRYGVEVE